MNILCIAALIAAGFVVGIVAIAVIDVLANRAIASIMPPEVRDALIQDHLRRNKK